MSTRFTRNLRNPETEKISGREIWFRFRGMLAVLLSIAVIGVAGVYAFDFVQEKWSEMKVTDDYEGGGVAEIELSIPAKSSLRDIADLLEKGKVIKTAKKFLQEAEANSDSQKIQSGRWKLRTQIPAKIALNMLLDSANQVHNRMTLKEGLWLGSYAKTMAKATGLPEKDFTNAFKNAKKIGLPDYADGKAEGFVFPDTYELPDKPTAVSVVKMAVSQFKKVAKKLDIAAKAKKLDLTPYEVVIVASLIEREVNKAEDRPKVARVVYNRLRAGMKLEFDSALHYALEKSGSLEMTSKELATDTPYNLRLYRNLPPTPISNPGTAALEAALEPATGNWLYFVVVDPASGKTEFSSTYAEFLKSKAKYKAWCKASKENAKLC